MISGRRLIAWAVLPMLAGCTSIEPQAPVARPPAAAPDRPPAGAQYLYGSAEAAAASRQAYAALLDHVRARLAAGPPRESVILAPDATLAAPRRLPCGTLPPAVVFDMDETAVLNLGYEYAETRAGGGFDQQRWNRWETSDGGAIAPVPGAVETFAALRRLGVAVIVNTNRNTSAADASARALAAAGLGAFRHGETLYLRGDVDGKGGKDGRRDEIARHYCVIAAAGDQLGDFTDLFAPLPPVARRTATGAPAIAALWGAGWFVLPNPVYGSGLQGGWDEVFPADRRWRDPAAPH